MASITIDLTDDQLRELQETAARFGVPPEDLVRARIEDMLTGRESNFERLTEYVLKKNAELYQRLA